MNTLNRYNAGKTLADLPFSNPIKKQIACLLENMEDDDRINVAKIHDELFPTSVPASANRALQRLLEKINEEAAHAQLAFSAQITTDKKAGAKNRWIWFEGPPAMPNPPQTSELKSIPSSQLLEQQGNYIDNVSDETSANDILRDKIPVIVLMTFNDHETNAVLNQFHPDLTCQIKPLSLKDGRTCLPLGKIGGFHIVQCESAQGESRAQQTADDILHGFSSEKVKSIIGVGIAFGGDEQKIGDVLVAEDVYDYEMAKQAKETEYRGKHYPTSESLFNLLKAIDISKRNSSGKHFWPKLHFGTILSGNKLIDEKQYRDELLKQAGPTAIGGDMEALGIYRAAKSNKKEFIVVKGVCDFADGNKNALGVKKEENQKLAAKNAAKVVYEMFLTGLSDPETFQTHRRTENLELGTTRLTGGSLEEVLGGRWLDNLARCVSFGKDDKIENDTNSEKGIVVLDALESWVKKAEPPHFFALLGEYGMGKTVTCQKLWETLREQHKKDPTTTPVPLYFDLRNVTGLDTHVPTLKEILEECMERGWIDQNGAAKFSIDTLYDLVERQAVVFILDGLDEVLVKLKEIDGQTFTRNLLKIADDIGVRRKSKGITVAPLKIIISCRTQFFRTLRDQQNHFTGQERGEYRANAFTSMRLLPLDEEQVLNYLKGAFPDMDTGKILETINAVHNLKELSQRPITLRWIADLFPEIEKDRVSGKPVYGVTLYRKMALRWLERDDGKHHIQKEHKMSLASHLAAYLWKENSGSLPATKIETWFLFWLESQPDIKINYTGLHLDKLKEDLRNSTFLSRQDEQDGSSFRFAHTSLLEFFLAQYLFDSIKENKPENWEMKIPSIETLDFLGQMLAEENKSKSLATLHTWGKAYRPLVNPLILHYSLLANEKNWPIPVLHYIDLSGADLQDLEINGTATQKFDLSFANFSGANLRRTEWTHVILDSCQFQKTLLTQATFDNCEAKQVNWSEADLTATTWHYCTLANGNWANIKGTHSPFLFCKGIHLLPLPGNLRNIPYTPSMKKKFQSGITNILYANGVYSPRFCSWSPNGTCLVTGGDGGVRIYDARTGQQELVIKVADYVRSCAWSPGGTRLLAGGNKGLCVYDARTGRQELVIKEADYVSSCAWSPDGTRLLAGGHHLCVYDARTGQQELVIKEADYVLFCAWSPDGTRLLARENKGLRVYDVRTGQQELVIEEADYVFFCAWSPDGTRLLVGGDKGLRVYDARTGRQELVIKEGDYVLSCAWSPDGTHLLAGGHGLHVYDAQTGQQELVIKEADYVSSCAWSSDGTRLLAGGHGLRVYDAQTGQQELVIREAGYINSCSWSPGGTRLLAGRSSLRVYDVRTGQQELVIKESGYVLSCAWSPDGTRLLAGGHGLRVYDAQTGQQELVIKEADYVSSCAWSPDGTHLLAGGRGLRVYHARTGQQKLIVKESGYVLSCAWSPDGTRLLIGGDNGLQVWDVQTGQQKLVIREAGSVRSCSWSPNGTRLLAGGDKGLRVWDAQSKQQYLVVEETGYVRSCSWSPDGTHLLARGDNGLEIWDAQTGQQKLVFKESYYDFSCSWSPDGTCLLSWGSGVWSIWDATTGENLLKSMFLENGSEAVWEQRTGKIKHTAGKYWRDFYWEVTNPDGTREQLPFESFGEWKE